MLNGVLRPVLARWHPLLLDHENRRQPEVSLLQHEHSWERAEELRQALNAIRESLVLLATKLAEVADVPPLQPPEPAG